MNDTSSATRLTAVFWSLCLLAPLPGLVQYISWLWDLDQYGYILPLIAALVALVLFRWDHKLRLPSNIFSVGFVVSGLLLTAAAAFVNSPWLSAVGFALLVQAWLHAHYAASDNQSLAYLGLLLVMLIRLPLNLDLQLTGYLQRVTSKVSSHILDSMGITHFVRGNVIDLPSGTLFVEEACSGVQSLFTILFLVCLLIVYCRRSVAVAPFYFLAGIGWAAVMNVMRITSIAVFQEWYAIDLSKGVPHEILGWICLGLAVLLLLSTDRLYRVLFNPIPATDTLRWGNPFVLLWNRLVTLGMPGDKTNEGPSAGIFGRSMFTHALLVIAALLTVPTVALGSKSLIQSFVTDTTGRSDKLIWEPPADLLAGTQWGKLVLKHDAARQANNKQLGANWDTWSLSMDGIPIRIAVSQPYPEWHDMCLCYTGSGWLLNDSQRNISDENQWGLSKAEFVKDSGEYGLLFFSAMNRKGDEIEPSGKNFRAVWDDRWKVKPSEANTVMLQLWVETETPLAPSRIDDIKELFQGFRSAARDAIKRLP